MSHHELKPEAEQQLTPAQHANRPCRLEDEMPTFDGGVQTMHVATEKCVVNSGRWDKNRSIATKNSSWTSTALAG